MPHYQQRSDNIQLAAEQVHRDNRYRLDPNYGPILKEKPLPTEEKERLDKEYREFVANYDQKYQVHGYLNYSF